MNTTRLARMLLVPVIVALSWALSGMYAAMTRIDT